MRMRPLPLSLALLILALAQAASAQPAPPARAARTAATRPAAVSPAKQLRINIAYQIALDKVDFSCGVMDGQFGPKSKMALKEYAARFFPGTDPYAKQVYDTLAVDVDHALTKYTITAEDAAQVGELPDNWNDKAKLTVLPYESLLDQLAEKFRCSKSLMIRLNPGTNMNALAVGKEITVPNVEPFGGMDAARAAKAGVKHAEYIAINPAEKTVRIYDADDKQMALFHCSVAKDKAKLPAADTKIRRMATCPNYTFNPKNWPEVTNVDHILTIPPGPRGPTGLVWMELELPGYGMHGVPKPELIGKTGSHGCFRLTNWDAVTVYGYAHPGMLIKIVNPER